jgi:hypothetical protein
LVPPSLPGTFFVPGENILLERDPEPEGFQPLPDDPLPSPLNPPPTPFDRPLAIGPSSSIEPAGNIIGGGSCKHGREP